jgi:hypothetical protein
VTHAPVLSPGTSDLAVFPIRRLAWTMPELRLQTSSVFHSVGVRYRTPMCTVALERAGTTS